MLFIPTCPTTQSLILFLLFFFLFVCFHWQQQEIIDVFAIAMQEAKALSPTFEAMFVPLDVPQWVTFYDLEQEAEYYYNPATNESQWERPEDEQPPVRLWQSKWQPMFDIQSLNYSLSHPIGFTDHVQIVANITKSNSVCQSFGH